MSDSTSNRPTRVEHGKIWITCIEAFQIDKPASARLQTVTDKVSTVLPGFVTNPVTAVLGGGRT